MSENYIKLAQLLEDAARALRKASHELSMVPSLAKQSVRELRGYKELSVRARKIFRRGDPIDFPGINFECVDDLLAKSEDDILGIKLCGLTALSEIKLFLYRNGLRLAGDPEWKSEDEIKNSFAGRRNGK